MHDSETTDLIELQTRLIKRLGELGFTNRAHARVLAHQLAEISARSRTVHEQAIPLLLAMDARHRRAMAEATLALKNHLSAIQDSITDAQSSLDAFINFLLADSNEKQ